MSTETQKSTFYGVARDKQLIKGGFFDVVGAQLELGSAEQRMRELGLEPDLRLVEYDVETTVKTSAVRAYKDPQPGADTEDAAGEDPNPETA